MLILSRVCGACPTPWHHQGIVHTQFKKLIVVSEFVPLKVAFCSESIFTTLFVLLPYYRPFVHFPMEFVQFHFQIAPAQEITTKVFFKSVHQVKS